MRCPGCELQLELQLLSTSSSSTTSTSSHGKSSAALAPVRCPGCQAELKLKLEQKLTTPLSPRARPAPSVEEPDSGSSRWSYVSGFSEEEGAQAQLFQWRRSERRDGPYMRGGPRRRNAEQEQEQEQEQQPVQQQQHEHYSTKRDEYEDCGASAGRRAP